MPALKCRFVLFGGWEHVAIVAASVYFLVDVLYRLVISGSSRWFGFSVTEGLCV